MLYLIFFAHWIGDFVCQSRSMATKKSSSDLYLLYHVAVYSLVLGIFSIFLGRHWIIFTFINFGLHYCIDWLTSRTTTYFWQKDNKKAFFTTIGFDQFLHAVCLLWTANQFLIV